MSIHSASSSALGYYYQSLQGLSLLFEKESDSVIYLERFDDVEFETDDSIEVIQLKHHIKTTGSLSDASADLWKTIKIWIDGFNSDNFILERSTFVIMTTGKCREYSATYFLRNDEQTRNVSKALEILLDTANRSTSATNKPTYDLFLKLTASNQYKLLDNVKIIDEVSDINQTKQDIMREIRWAVRTHQLNSFYEHLIGWWFRIVIEHLSGNSRTPIYFDELDAKLHDISDQYKSENLPINFKSFIPTVHDENYAKELKFVKQMEIISLRDGRIKKAISDYYKSVKQRSSWIREKLLFLDELNEYENELVDEWDRYFLQITEQLQGTTVDRIMEEEGRKIFNWMERDVNLCIRKNCTEPYVMRGSYHILSNEERVGWHPKFREKLQQIFANQGDLNESTNRN